MWLALFAIISNIWTLLFKEIKVSRFQARTMLKFIWKNAKIICTEHEKGKGDTSILVHPKWNQYISQWGFCACNRLVWISLKSGLDVMGILSLYASNKYK